MSISGHRLRSPADIRFFNTLTQGSRGFHIAQTEEEHLDAEAIAEYGIDWDTRGLAQPDRQGDDPFPNNPFLTYQPDRLSYVEVDEARCPFDNRQLHYLSYNLSLIPPALFTVVWDQRKQLVIVALLIATQVANTVEQMEYTVINTE